MVATVASLAVFVVTLVLVLLRPRGWPEAVWTTLGAALLLATGLVTLGQAEVVLHAAAEPLLFLAALLLLSALLERSGFFEWAALWAARASGGEGRALYRNVFVLGAAITAIMSLDTTAVILTPIVLAVVRRLKVEPRPFIIACAFVANVGSLALPVSNLTNLLFLTDLNASFASFALRLGIPNLVGVAVCYLLCARRFRDDLPQRFSCDDLPEPTSAVAHRGYFVTSVLVLCGVCVGYFVAPLMGVPPYVFGFAGVALLLVAGALTRRVDAKLVQDVPWSVFPFVIGLFIVVSAAQHTELGAATTKLFASLPTANWLAIPSAAGLSALASNLLNNLPAALLVRDALHAAHASPAALYGALLGTNIGPNVLVTGSLATMLVLTRAREQGAAPSPREVVLAGAQITPLALLAAVIALVLTFVVAP